MRKTKENKKRKNQGITLIALVITIIVLLILAGVSLSLVMGNDGILGRAETAVIEHNQAQEEEQEELVKAEFSAEFYQKKYVENDPEVQDLEITEYVNEKLGIQTLASQITTANYGDYVDLETNLIVKDKIPLEDGTLPKTDWRVFHKDSSGGVYLIFADYLPYSYETIVESGLTNYGLQHPYNWRSSTSRTDLITKLEDTSKWNNLIDSRYIAKGIKVTGAPTIENWIDSWNLNDGYTKLYISSNETGYFIGINENPVTTEQGISSCTVGYTNTLYFPHRVSLSNNYCYWWIAPSAASDNNVLFASYNGWITNDDYADVNRGIRPVVYIPSGIYAKKYESTGIWKIK